MTAPASAQSILYVDDDAPPGGNGSSWSTAYSDLEQALTDGDASGGVVQELRVAGGIYLPTRLTSPQSPRSATFYLRPLRVIGGYAGSTSTPDLRDPELYPSILSGDLGVVGDPADNSYRVVTIVSSITPASVLDGFVITGGNANGFADRGAGMYVEGDATIRSCKIRGNTANFEAGGVYNRGDGAWIDCAFENNRVAGNGSGGAFWNFGYAHLTRCTFTMNQGGNGAGIHNTSPILTVEGCTFSRNSGNNGTAINSFANSAAIRIQDCSFDQNTSTGSGCISAHGSGPMHVVRCVFTENHVGQYGGGIYTTLPQLFLTNCTFIGNTAADSGGAIVSYLSDLEISNCVFSGNSAPFGGAMADRGQPSRISNCTFSRNVATSGRGGALHIEANSTIQNSILWQNSDIAGTGETSEIWVQSGSVSLAYCCVQGWSGTFGGVGNQGSDPLFVLAAGSDGAAGTLDDNLRLQAPSPSIDAGSSALLPPDVSDLDADGNTSEATPFDRDAQARIVGNAVDLGAHEWTVFMPTAYCVAKVNSMGCTPSIGYSGLPTLTGADDFVVSAATVLNQKKGVLLWGLVPSSIPFGGGTLCIQSPIVRNPGLNSFGNPGPLDCSGSYSCAFDQQYMATQSLDAGTQVYAQYWSRDPGFAAPNKIGLTDGLQFTILP